MTYEEWIKDHNEKVAAIHAKFPDYSNEEIIKYFDWDNMVEKEPKFCLLYKDKKKCHEVDTLNCYYCACPYFSINPTPRTSGKTTIASICTIASRNRDVFYAMPDENNVVKIHCDCTDCTIPHTAKFANSFMNKVTNFKVSESESLLEYVRRNK